MLMENVSFFLLLHGLFLVILLVCLVLQGEKSNGFLIIEANGGLNQQRLSVCLPLSSLSPFPEHKFWLQFKERQCYKCMEWSQDSTNIFFCNYE